MKKIQVIGAGKYQLPAIIKAKEKGLSVIATDRDPDAYGRRYADYFEVADVKDGEANLSIARKYQIDGVISIVSELGVKTTSYVAKHMGLPGLDSEAAEHVTNKLKMKTRLAEEGIPVAEFTPINRLDDIEEVIKRRGFPFVLKPVDNAGSRGVMRIDNTVDIEDAFKKGLAHSFSGTLIAEDFIDGIEFTIEAISYNREHSILAVSEKKRIPFPHCVSIDLTYPPSVAGDIQQKIKELVYRTLNALGVDNGASHSEVMIDQKGSLYLVETAGRGGGYGVFSDIIRLVSGVDAVEQSINITMGFPVDLNQRFNNAAVLRFFTLREGKLVAVKNLEKARQIKGVYMIDIFIKVGEDIGPIVSDGTRPGMVITSAETREEAIRIADEVEDRVEFVVSDEK